MNFFKRKFLIPLQTQLTQGAHPRGLAQTFAAAATLGIIPIMGIATTLCVAVGVKFKLNQPLLQAVNYLLYPVQVLLIPLFLKGGAKLFGEPALVFDLTQLTQEFKQDAGLFFQHYGIAGLHAFVLWALIAPFLAAFVYGISFFILSRVLKRKNEKKAITAKV